MGVWAAGAGRGFGGATRGPERREWERDCRHCQDIAADFWDCVGELEDREEGCDMSLVCGERGKDMAWKRRICTRNNQGLEASDEDYLHRSELRESHAAPLMQ